MSSYLAQFYDIEKKSMLILCVSDMSVAVIIYNIYCFNKQTKKNNNLMLYLHSYKDTKEVFTVSRVSSEIVL